LWAYGLPQSVLGLESPNILDNLFSSVIEVSILLVLGVVLLVWKTVDTSENIRIDKTHSDVPEHLVIPVAPTTTIEMSFDTARHYASPPMMEACLRWGELDREEFFLVEAGALDIPKLTLCSIVFNSASQSLLFELGSASFFDIFHTHYSPDLVLSRQSASERRDITTLRTLFDGPVSSYYKEEIKVKKLDDLGLQNKQILRCLDFFPNPLGISGVVLIFTATRTLALLRKRASHEIAAKDLIEWSFAGLVEATRWIHVSKIDFLEFAKLELQDEVVDKSETLNCIGIEPVIEPLGIVFNRLYLYQPELFVVAKYASISDEQSDKLIVELGKNFMLVPVSRLPDEFEKHELKNLCMPGLDLLKSAYPDLFSDRQGA
jgi:hypothetical protein